MILYNIWWDVSPEIFSFLPIRWYGTLFALGFFIAYHLSIKLYTKEGYPAEWVDHLFIYTMVATIIGARLGHVLFYDPAYYFANPLDILKVWEGGLASHGATFALLITMYIYSRKITHQPFLWGVDRVVIVIAIVACLIRLGNLFNSEIVGMPSKNSTAFVFAYPLKEAIMSNLPQEIASASYVQMGQDTMLGNNYLEKAHLRILLNEKFPVSDVKKMDQLKRDIKNILFFFSKKEEHILILDTVQDFLVSKTAEKQTQLQIDVWGKPRLPAQLFESIFYLSVFFMVYAGFTRGGWRKKNGLTSGIFFMLVFGFRFFVEYFKEVQEPWEQGLSLNQGQMLSIPMVLIGLTFVILSLRTSSKAISHKK